MIDPSAMTAFIALGGFGVGIAGATFTLVLRIERRLTRIETVLKLDERK